MPYCVPCKQEHIEQLKHRIRKSDQEELRLSSDREPSVSLQLSFEYSLDSYAVIKDDVVLCVFGVCPHQSNGRLGVPWLICAEEFIAVAGRRFAFQCKKEVKKLAAPFQTLVNVVWVENSEAIKWLKWLGFSFHPSIKYGPHDAYFYPFVLNKDSLNV